MSLDKLEDRCLLTLLTVTASAGTYGGTVDLTADLSLLGVPLPGELIDFQIGSTNLGNGSSTDSNGMSVLENVPISGLAVGTYTNEISAGFLGSILLSLDPASANVNLDVLPAPLTITANNQTKVYGGALPTLTDTYTGFVNGDTSASLSTQPTTTTTATSASHVVGNPYAITASGAVDPNYTISYFGGSLNVTSAPLTITANNQTKIYGATLPTLTDTYTGLVNNDTAASLETLPTLSTLATSASHVAGSPYAITASAAVDPDYTISYVAGTLTFTTAPLTITANNQTKIYGATLPTLTDTYTGLVNNDTVASLETLPTLSTLATSASHVAGSPYAITASGALDPDYTISYVGGSLSVTTAPLTITANNQTKIYGATLPTLTDTYTGLVNNDTVASLETLPTLSTLATSASHVAGSPYAITASAAVDPDYTISYVAGTLTVTTAPLTITANNLNKVYGASLPTLTDSYTGFVNGDSSASLSTQPTTTTTATSASHVAGSPYAVTVSGAVDPDYTISYVAGTLTVTTAPLTITANNLNKVYGASLPTLTDSYTGFVNGDTAASLATLPTTTTTATSASHVAGSPYAITASAAVDPDYTISYGAGTLNVTTAPLTITANNQTKIYGATLPTLTDTYTGLVNNDTAASLETLPTLSTLATSASHVAGSPYAVTVSGAVDPDYTISYVGGSLTVTTAPLTITANNQTKIYGAALPTLTDSYTGFVNGDSSASLSTQPTTTTTATSASHVVGNPYAITASGAVDPDYTISYVGGSLTVTAAPLTITANDQTKVYGAALPTLTDSYTGFVNGDSSASLTTQPTTTSTATTASHVAGNPYAVTASGAVDPDYTISYVGGSLTVTTASLTITANNQTKIYGASLPTLTDSYTGFVNGDSSASLSTQPTTTTTATSASHVVGNPYAITASGAVDPDYTISYVGGSLNVTTAPLTIAANDQTKIYGASLPTLTDSYTGFVNGDSSASLTTQPTTTSTATTASHVAGNPYAVTASAAVDPDYTISYVGGSLTVTTAPLTISADNQTKVYGAALPTFTATYTGLVNGDTAASLATPPTFTTNATSASPVVVVPYNIAASGAVDPDYTISYVAGSLTITTAPLTITPDSLTKVYGAEVPTLTASYSGFVNGDSPASLETSPTLTSDVVTYSDVAYYPITASGASDPNYSIIYAAGSLAVTPAPLVIVADNQSKVYGQSNPTLTGSVSGVLNDDDVTITFTTLATQYSDVQAGGYVITATNATGSKALDYSPLVEGGSSTPGTLTITQAPVTVVVADQSRLYGQYNATLTGTLSGVLNDDDVVAVLSTSATAASDVLAGGYAINGTGLAGTKAIDYQIVESTPGTLTVTPAPLTGTVTDFPRFYGQPNPAFDIVFSSNPFAVGQGPNVLGGSLVYSTTATTASDVGNYTVTPTGLTSSDYTLTLLPGNMAVAPAPLTVTVTDFPKVYGQPNPAFDIIFSSNPFAVGQGPNVLGGSLVYSTTGTTASDVGNYPVTPTGLTSVDYHLTIVPGNMAITPAPLTITATNNSKYFGQPNPAFDIIFSSNPFAVGQGPNVLGGSLVYSTAATTSSDVGNYPVTPTGLTSADYTLTVVPGNLSVTYNPGQDAFVTSLYQTILDRAPETNGLNGWLLALANGESQVNVATQIYNSDEAQSDRAQPDSSNVTLVDAYNTAITAENATEGG